MSQEIDPIHSEGAAFWVIYGAAHCAGRLLRNGLFVRGGVARGWTFHQRSVLYGQGVIAAYDLEANFARLPRVIVAANVVDMLEPHERRCVLRRDIDDERHHTS